MSILGATSRLVRVPPAGSVPNYVGDYDNGAYYGIGAVVSTPAGSPYGNAGQLFIRVSNPNNPGYPPGTSTWSAYDLDATAMYRGSTKIWPVVDLDAQDYINRVQAADSAALGGTQTLEEGVKNAINNFVVGCKKDGIWGKISNSAILCGARSLQGALCKLTGYSPYLPVSYGFVQGDYSRTLGLLGPSNSTSGKYIDTGEPISYTRYGEFPESSAHAAAYVGTVHGGIIMGSADSPSTAQIGLRPFNATSSFFRLRDSMGTYPETGTLSAGFVMAERQFSNTAVWSHARGVTTVTTNGVNLVPYPTTLNNTVWLFRRNQNGATTGAAQFNGRILYYSLGRSITDVATVEAYYFGGGSRYDLDTITLNGVYKRSGTFSFSLQHPNTPSTSLSLEEYDPVTNDQRYVLGAFFWTGVSGGAFAYQNAYVSMTKSPAGTQYPPSGPYQRVSRAVTTTEAPYVTNDQQSLINGISSIYKTRVDALIAGIQGSIV
jgi:hypothetical protein